RFLQACTFRSQPMLASHALRATELSSAWGGRNGEGKRCSWAPAPALPDGAARSALGANGSALRVSPAPTSADAQLALQGGGRGGVLEQEFFARIDDVVSSLCHQRRFVKTRQNKLELAGIGIDVANGEDAGLARLEFRSVDGNEVLVEVE